MYNGETLGLINRSEKSRFSKVSSGDVIAVFVNMEEGVIEWFLNNSFAAKLEISSDLRGERMFPFIEVTSMGDEI